MGTAVRMFRKIPFPIFPSAYCQTAHAIMPRMMANLIILFSILSELGDKSKRKYHLSEAVVTSLFPTSYLCLMRLLLALLLSTCFFYTKAQDKIHLRSGGILNAVVLDVGTDKIRYKKYSNQNGPNYFLEKYDVKKIVYENGAEDYFGQVEAPLERKLGIGINWMRPIIANNIADPFIGGSIELSYFIVPKLGLEAGVGNGPEGFFLWAGGNIMFKDTRTERFIPYAGFSVVSTQLYTALYPGFNIPVGVEFIHRKSGFNASVDLSYLNILNDVGYLRACLKLGYRFK